MISMLSIHSDSSSRLKSESTMMCNVQGARERVG
jgi:hypothetical protein